MKLNKLLWGVFFIAAAVLMVINQLGYFTGLNMWSLLFTILVIPVISSGLYRRNFFNVFFGIAVLLIVFAKPLNITALVPWTILVAALFLSIGFSILFKPKYRNISNSWHDRSWDSHNHNYTEQETVDHVDGNDVNCSVSLGGSCKYLHSSSLETARFDCSMGYLKVYFDNVQLHPGGAVVNVDCSLGSMDLYFPRDWNIVIDVNCIMGNVEENQHLHNPAGPSLTIRGNVRLGNLGIKYV